MDEISNSAAQRIVVLGTGGTIAGSGGAAGDNISYVAGTIGVNDLLAGIKAPPGYELVVEQVAQLDSKDMDFAVWQQLTQRCVYWLSQPNVAGIVITHGTDTIEETSFFLHEVLALQSKPVVLTCAMRPATALSPDGPQNLLDAVTVAAKPGAAGVVVVCAGEIHGANDVRKAHPYRVNALDSGDAGPIGYVEEHEVRLVRSWPSAAVPYNPRLAELVEGCASWPRVEILTSHAGAHPSLINALIRERAEGNSEAVDGLVLAATGNGTLHHELESAALRAQDADITVWRASRCLNGRILPKPGDQIPDTGTLSPVKARISLILSLLIRQMGKE
ncbi:MAG TPA: asparaginase [Burkholderiaceae bacterium]|nr:asparaginase [Burkholderiaceae bacterium]